MSKSTSSSNTCLLPSELSPKQLESLPFVPGVLSNFDEKEKLPPTARAQWTYVQVNPIDFLNRFTNELGLLGVNVAICFINKEPYEDEEQELKTPITVNLIVQPERISLVADHLQKKNISHLVLEDNKGFALPYLGSIQKTVDALALECLVSYMFIKNSISREAYSSWLSVPKKYLEAKKAQAKVVKNQAPSAKTKQASIAVPSDNRKEDQPKEDFNYVIYDDTGETAPPIIPQPQEEKPQSVVVANPPPKKKKSFLSKFSSRSTKSKKASKALKGSKNKSKACPLAKFDAAFFVFLGLFNLHCSILLLNFLSTTVDAFASIMIEATTGAAFISLLFTIFVIRPSFRMKERRLWSLVGYVAYTGVAGFQIFRSFSFPDTAGYLIPGALTFVFIMATVVSSFMRIDRMNANKGESAITEEASEEEPAVESVEIELEAVDSSPAPAVAQKAIDLPAPTKKKEKKKDSKKIELKPVKKADPAKEDPEVPAVQAEPEQKAVKVPSQKSIPTKPITDQQKEAIRSRLSRRDALSTPSQPISSESEEQPSSTSDEQKPLSTAEIKARLAERLQKARATNSGLNDVGKPTQNAEITPKAEETAKQADEPKKSVLLKKTTGGRKERANKLSLPNS